MGRYIVTITPPTPNGDLHLGHLAGPFLAADICARILRQQRHNVLLLSYSDDYQSYLLRKSHETSRELREIASANATAILESLKSVDIHLSHFLRAIDNSYFLNEVARYFDIVESAGDLVSHETAVPFCASCNVYGYEGFGRATCNYCGSPSDASQCEGCARVPELEKMGSMRCVLCQALMESRPTRRIVWRIGRRYPDLRIRYLSTRHRPALAEYLKEVLGQEQDEWPLTRPGEPAIPLARDLDQPVHTWFSGLAGYRATLAEYVAKNREADLDQWWSRDTRLVEFLGFDCSYSHAVAYTAMLGLDANAPSYVYHFTNKFLKLDGADFSTSRNHAIWIRDLSASFPSDAIRLYTALLAPEDSTRNFRPADFRHWIKEDYERRILGGSWRTPSASTLEPYSQALEGITAPILQEWWRASSVEEFSIARLGRVQISLLEAAESANPDHRDTLWLLFAKLGQAIHPGLSAEIENTILHGQPEASPWLKQVLAQ